MAVSSSEQSPIGIGELPEWALVAFASRVALRVLPASLPIPSPRADAISGFRAAQACGFIAMHVALSAGGPYRRLLDEASQEVQDLGQTEARSRLANQCLAAAADMGADWEPAEDGTDEQQIRTGRVARLVALYHGVAGTYAVYDAFDVAANADIAELAKYRLGPEQAVPAEFFARPLFDPAATVPDRWQPVVEAWAAALAMVELSSFYELYVAQCGGTRLSIADVEAILAAWAQGAGLLEPQSTVTVDPPKPNVEDPPQGPPLLMLADRPLEGEFDKRDFLGFKDYAQSLAVILDDVVETPFTMAINAPWGAGKTSLANMVAARLERLSYARIKEKHIICRFNAWMHDDAPNLATALVSEVCRQADRRRPMWRRVIEPLPAQLLETSGRRWRRSSYALVVLVLTLLAFWQVGEHLTHVDERTRYDAAVNETYQHTTMLSPDGKITTGTSETASRVRARVPAPRAPATLGPAAEVLKWLQTRLVLLGTFLTAFVGLVGVAVKFLSSTSLLSFVQSPDKAAEAGTIQAAQRTVGRFIAQATARGNRFIVFVDDIERCKPPRAVDVLDAVNQLLDHRNVVVVLLGDMAAVAAAAQVKYKDMAEIYVPTPDLVALDAERRKEVFGRLYIQKIVQFQFDLPTVPPERMQEYVTRLLELEDEVRGRHVGAAA